MLEEIAAPPYVICGALPFAAVSAGPHDVLIEFGYLALVHVTSHLCRPYDSLRKVIQVWVHLACIAVDLPELFDHIVACVPAPLGSVSSDSRRLKG